MPLLDSFICDEGGQATSLCLGNGNRTQSNMLAHERIERPEEEAGFPQNQPKGIKKPKPTGPIFGDAKIGQKQHPDALFRYVGGKLFTAPCLRRSRSKAKKRHTRLKGAEERPNCL